MEVSYLDAEFLVFGQIPSESINVLSGIVHRFQFNNGFGASVACHGDSYGGTRGLWELAVTDNDGTIIYNTEITDDVLGHLTELEVSNLLVTIKYLNSDGTLSQHSKIEMEDTN